MPTMKLTPTSTQTCKPKTGETYCVRGYGENDRAVHRHFDSASAANLFEKQLIAAQLGQHQVDRRGGRTTFKAYALRWHDAQTQADPSTSLYALQRAFQLIGETKLDRIDGVMLTKLQTTLLKRYARNSVELTMHYVKTVIRQAVSDRVISNDPTVRLRLPRRDPLDTNGVVTTDDVPTQAEALAILAATPPRWRLGVALGFGCGFRVGEVLGLTPGQVDLVAGTVVVDAQQQRRGRVSPKTWRGKRTIDVPDVVLFHLRRELRIKSGSAELIFLGVRGGVPRRDDFYDTGWRPALEGAGLSPDEYKFHAARHFAVSSMLARGVPITEVAYYVGDAVETVSRVYAHWLRDAP